MALGGFAAALALATAPSVAAVRAVSIPYGVYSLSQGNLGFRHCDYQAFTAPKEAGNNDFIFEAVPALNMAPNAVSFQSTNYPTQYVSVLADNGFAEKGRLGIMEGGNADDASFTVVAGLNNPALYSIQSLSTAFKGQYITTNNVLSGSCAGDYQAPAGDTYLSDGSNAAAATWTLDFTPPPSPPNVTIDLRNVTRTLDPNYVGCHFDPGYTNQVQAFYANMIYAETPSAAAASWSAPVSTGGGTGSSGIDNGVRFGAPNLPTLRITSNPGTGTYGVAHRGLGNEGLFLESGRDYNGYLYLQGAPGTIVTLALSDKSTGTTLASTSVTLAGSASSWQKLSFGFASTSAGASCAQVTPGSDPSIDCGKIPNGDHICVSCGGQFTISIPAGSVVHVGYGYLQPGAWGTYKGLPVKQSVVDLLTAMGTQVIRQGGTVSQTFAWKDWRGAPENRASLGHKWGIALVSGWGPFEIIDMCNAAGIEPILTFAYDLNKAEDWADLVEYCHGDIATTTWGKQRAADGHPAPYRLQWTELGNEQENPDFVAQVTAMEARIKLLNLNVSWQYMYPTNGGPSTAMLGQLAAAGVDLTRVMPDIHIGGGGAVPQAVDDFKRAGAQYPISAINCETNAETHNVGRALDEATDLNEWFNMDATLGARLTARTASFCTERSAHFDGFDQGLAFFLPGQTWLQPPGYVHAMLAATPADQALSVNFPADWQSKMSVSAQRTASSNMTYVRVTNNQRAASNITITIANAPKLGSTATVWTLSAATVADSNPPTNPTNISPKQASVPFVNGATMAVPANAYMVVGIPTA